jgi:hypothetical protein
MSDAWEIVDTGCDRVFDLSSLIAFPGWSPSLLWHFVAIPAGAEMVQLEKAGKPAKFALNMDARSSLKIGDEFDPFETLHAGLAPRSQPPDASFAKRRCEISWTVASDGYDSEQASWMSRLWRGDGDGKPVESQYRFCTTLYDQNRTKIHQAIVRRTWKQVVDTTDLIRAMNPMTILPVCLLDDTSRTREVKVSLLVAAYAENAA